MSQLCALYLHRHHGGGLETGLHLLGTDSRVHEVRFSMSKLDNNTFLWGFYLPFLLWSVGSLKSGRLKSRSLFSLLERLLHLKTSLLQSFVIKAISKNKKKQR